MRSNVEVQMAVKLALFLVVLMIVLSVAVGGSFWYLTHRAKMNHKENMADKAHEREREKELWDE